MPSFVNAGAWANSGNAITPNLPSSIQIDDILLLLLETLDTEAITIANANGGTWAEVDNSPQFIDDTRLTVFWSRYNGTQGSPTTSDSGNHNTGVMLAYRGCIKAGEPWDITVGSTQAATTAGSITGLTTSVDNCMIVSIAASDRDAASTTNATDWANASLVSITERADQVFFGGAGGGIVVADGVKTSAGLVDATTWTQEAAASLANLMIALKEAPFIPTTTDASSDMPQPTYHGQIRGRSAIISPRDGETTVLIP